LTFERAKCNTNYCTRIDDRIGSVWNAISDLRNAND